MLESSVALPAQLDKSAAADGDGSPLPGSGQQEGMGGENAQTNGLVVAAHQQAAPSSSAMPPGSTSTGPMHVCAFHAAAWASFACVTRDRCKHGPYTQGMMMPAPHPSFVAWMMWQQQV